MEEILDSIRRIIADDDPSQMDAPPAPPRPVAPARRPVAGYGQRGAAPAVERPASVAPQQRLYGRAPDNGTPSFEAGERMQDDARYVRAPVAEHRSPASPPVDDRFSEAEYDEERIGRAVLGPIPSAGRGGARPDGRQLAGRQADGRQVGVRQVDVRQVDGRPVNGRQVEALQVDARQLDGRQDGRLLSGARAQGYPAAARRSWESSVPGPGAPVREDGPDDAPHDTPNVAPHARDDMADLRALDGRESGPREPDAGGPYGRGGEADAARAYDVPARRHEPRPATDLPPVRPQPSGWVEPMASAALGGEDRLAVSPDERAPRRPEPAAEANQRVPAAERRVSPPRKDLLSPAVDAAVAAAFKSLGDLVLPQQERTVEDLVKEILRPMLKEWLDQHLAGIVERLVRAEIERVTSTLR